MLTDPRLRAAQDDSCLLYLTPLGWDSPLRQGTVWPPGGGSGTDYAEKLGLIAKVNISAANGYFEAANPNILAQINTVLDLAGNRGPITFLTRTYFSKGCAFFVGLPLDTYHNGIALTYNAGMLNAIMRSDGHLYDMRNINAAGGWHTAGLLWHPGGRNKCYVDGSEVASIANSATALKQPAGYEWIGMRAVIGTGSINTWGQMLPTAWLLIMNRILSASEIAYLSN